MIFTNKRTSIFTCEFPIWYCLITQGIPRVMEQLQVEDGAQQCSCFTKLCCAAAAVLRTISVREDPHFLDNSTSYHCYHYDFPKSHLPKSSQFGFPSLLHCIHIYIYHICILYICLKKKLRTCAQNRAFQSLLRERVADSVKAASTRCFWCLGTDFCSPWISPWISDIDIGKIWWRYPLVN